MKCPITYEKCPSQYSAPGLKSLSRQLTGLNDFPYSAEEQRREAAARASKISIQGIQPKLSVRLNIKKQIFEIADTHGQYILKPQSAIYEQLPENESLTMRLAQIAGINTPLHGLIHTKGKSLTYFIKRFDRYGRNKKRAVEDFAQLSGNTRDTKYNSSMEKVVEILDTFCTFPALEKANLFRLIFFNFLIGNEDMHLKNFSLLTDAPIVKLSPAYDLVNTSIALHNPKEEIALPIKGKKRNLSKKLLVTYFAKNRLDLSAQTITAITASMQISLPAWKDSIQNSFLSSTMKKKYLSLIQQRATIMEINT